MKITRFVNNDVYDKNSIYFPTNETISSIDNTVDFRGFFVNNLGPARTLFTKTSSIAYQSEMLLRERDNASYKTSMTSLEQEDTFAERQTGACFSKWHT